MTSKKKQRKPSKKHIDELFDDVFENLDPKWEAKRDYLLYVRQLERLNPKPSYIQ